MLVCAQASLACVTHLESFTLPELGRLLDFEVAFASSMSTHICVREVNDAFMWNCHRRLYVAEDA